MSSSSEEKGSGSTSHDNDSISVYERPKGLRAIYYHPLTQIIMLGFVCFLCPGMFNALTGLGGGGQVDATTSANANSAVYATYAVSAFFSGTVNNKIGARLTLLFGTLGYALYVSSYLVINIHPDAGWFLVTSGALLGVTAGFLWTAQGSLMLSYCTEAQKGIYISIFWGIFSLGAVVGSAVSLGQNFNSTSNGVGNGTYIGILVLTLVGVTIPMMMADPAKMIRTDGTRVVMPRHPSWKSEFHGLWVAIVTDPMVLLLFPLFCASAYFYTWQFNDYNAALFNIRARSLNNFVHWLSQIFGSVMLGFVLDSKWLRRRGRAFAGWFILLVVAFVVHIWAYEYQKTYTRSSVLLTPKMDIYDPRYPAHIWLMIFYGLLDAMWHVMCFWLIGAMSNDTNKLAIYSGFFHSIQAAGSAIGWRLDAIKLPYMNIFISTWCLVAAGLVFSFPMIYLRVRDTTVLEDEGLIRRDQGLNDNDMKVKGVGEGHGNEMP
ncbi:major facilitator superfamily domain-containing protein [Suillus paluster]|uniref:major facilitator superfamily domain-containing protein n=1 Tax=Suillus paluster TaxID=48578 RepID=UPI001B877F70|nr:major facilitator superfamily domain-containing protein [Suillus paluster]KAG1730558.1 major facilitator superfamily domain-containing protein [Suillus paluster]